MSARRRNKRGGYAPALLRRQAARLTIELKTRVVRARQRLDRLKRRATQQRLESFCPGPKVNFVRPSVSRLCKNVDIGLGD